jgi:hypothetical protein
MQWYGYKLIIGRIERALIMLFAIIIHLTHEMLHSKMNELFSFSYLVKDINNKKLQFNGSTA